MMRSSIIETNLLFCGLVAYILGVRERRNAVKKGLQARDLPYVVAAKGQCAAIEVVDL